MAHLKPPATPAWRALTVLYDKIKTVHPREMFEKDPGRGERFVVAFLCQLPRQVSNTFTPNARASFLAQTGPMP